MAKLNQAETLSTIAIGKARRLRRIFSAESGKTIIIPVDDSLIFGPTGGLEQFSRKLPKLAECQPNAILAFHGVFRTHSAALANVAGIANMTASTSRSQHTRKVRVCTVEQAVQLGLDGVAVHVNISSKYESEMLQILGAVARECDYYGMPLLAIMYPRSEGESGDNNYDELRETDRIRYAEFVAHSARIGVDLGADIVKTKYTGDPESFRIVVEACKPIPVVIAGGPVAPISSMLQIACDVVHSGGAGVSFGRNVFGRKQPQPFIAALQSVVHRGATPDQVAICDEITTTS